MGNIRQYDFGDVEFITTLRTSKPYPDAWVATFLAGPCCTGRRAQTAKALY